MHKIILKYHLSETALNKGYLFGRFSYLFRKHLLKRLATILTELISQIISNRIWLFKLTIYHEGLEVVTFKLAPNNQ